MTRNQQRGSTPDKEPIPTVPIRFVALDAVGTLIEADPPVVDAYAEIGRRHGSRLNRDEVGRRFAAALEKSAEMDRKRGPEGLATSEEAESKRWRWVVGEVFVEIEDEGAAERCFEELFAHFGRPSSWRCFDDVATAIASIERLGLGMVIASNFDCRLHTICTGWAPLQLAKAVVVSSEVGWKKPGPKFFGALVDACGCRADEVLMVGDDPVNDVGGALDSGLQAVRVDRSHDAIEGAGWLPSMDRPTVIRSLTELGVWCS
ncbi:MAG TPA: haloacid dehalogenase [Planctomycetaceae bacterium]|nr:haloacid dehalogenase [Planctomycetaceae bacterium]HCD01917.1 haloacid dehalogenase [Planctomycetaceae bacterium]|tara:strand:- start:1637 stop:2419 length:783 start_codon:yes stop_codon:yes gene_type:complete